MTDPIVVATDPEQESYWERLAPALLPAPAEPRPVRWTDFAVGTRVTDATRCPDLVQPWLHPVYVGVVQQAGASKAEWNRTNSERDYCDLTNRVPVRYDFGNRYTEQAAHLLVVDRVPELAEYALLKLCAATASPIRADVGRGPDGFWTEFEVYVVGSGEQAGIAPRFAVALFKRCWASNWLIYSGQLDHNPHAYYFGLTPDGRAAIARYETALAEVAR